MRLLPLSEQRNAVFLARMHVPKMVKNGLNSSFWVWGQFYGAHLFCGTIWGKPMLFAMPRQYKDSYFKQAHIVPERLKEE